MHIVSQIPGSTRSNPSLHHRAIQLLFSSLRPPPTSTFFGFTGATVEALRAPNLLPLSQHACCAGDIKSYSTLVVCTCIGNTAQPFGHAYQFKAAQIVELRQCTAMLGEGVHNAETKRRGASQRKVERRNRLQARQREISNLNVNTIKHER